MFRAFSFAAAPSARSTYQPPDSPELFVQACFDPSDDVRSVSPTSDHPSNSLPLTSSTAAWQSLREKTMAELGVDPLSPIPASVPSSMVDVKSITTVPELVERFQIHSISGIPHVQPTAAPLFTYTPFPDFDDTGYHSFIEPEKTYEYDEALGMDDESYNDDDYLHNVERPFGFHDMHASSYSSIDNASRRRPISMSSMASTTTDVSDNDFHPPPASSLRQRRQALHYDAAQLRDISVLIRQMVEAGDQCAICSPTPSSGSAASSSYGSTDGSDDAARSSTGLPNVGMFGLRYRRSAECVNPVRRVVKSVRQRKSKNGTRKRVRS